MRRIRPCRATSAGQVLVRPAGPPDGVLLGAIRSLAVAAPHVGDRWFPAGVDAAALLGASGGAAPSHRVPAQRAFTAAIRAGLGWGMVPQGAVAGLVRRGEPVDLSPGDVLDVPLFWQHWKVDAPVLRALTERVLEAATEGLEPSF